MSEVFKFEYTCRTVPKNSFGFFDYVSEDTIELILCAYDQLIKLTLTGTSRNQVTTDNVLFRTCLLYTSTDKTLLRITISGSLV